MFYYRDITAPPEEVNGVLDWDGYVWAGEKAYQSEYLYTREQAYTLYKHDLLTEAERVETLLRADAGQS